MAVPPPVFVYQMPPHMGPPSVPPHHVGPALGPPPSIPPSTSTLGTRPYDHEADQPYRDRICSIRPFNNTAHFQQASVCVCQRPMLERLPAVAKRRPKPARFPGQPSTHVAPAVPTAAGSAVAPNGAPSQPAAAGGVMTTYYPLGAAPDGAAASTPPSSTPFDPFTFAWPGAAPTVA